MKISIPANPVARIHVLQISTSDAGLNIHNTMPGKHVKLKNTRME